MKMLQSYLFNRAEDVRAIVVPLVAIGHDEDFLVPPQSLQAWAGYAPAGAGTFELVALEDHVDGEVLAAQGHGFSRSPTEALLGRISGTCTKYELGKELVDILPDIGPTDSPLPTEVDCVVVGAGIAGVCQGRAFRDAGRSVAIIDRYDKIGGIWTYYANKFSRVNSSEPAYRVVNQEGPASRPNEDHSPTHDILRDIYTVAAMSCLGKFYLRTNVVKIEKLPDSTYNVHTKNVATGKTHTVHCRVISIHVNRRIGKRRDVVYPGESHFRGDIVYGYANEVCPLQFWGKRVIVVGAGAFAFENLRTALEHGARHVTMLGRRAGSTCPKWIDMIAFLRPLDEWFNTNRNGNIISFDGWRRCYEDAGLPTPDCWAEGLLKPHNHTVSVSDMGFIAGYHGMVDLKVGEIKEFRADGQGVVLKDGRLIDCDIVIKATGFHLNDEVPKMTGHDKMYSFGLLDLNMQYGAEPLLDGGQFGSAKGNIAKGEAEDTETSEKELWEGVQTMQKLGLPDVSQRANPFGSSYAGPMLAQAYYFSWLAEHEGMQKDLIENAGPPTQGSVQLWSSVIGASTMRTVKKLVGSLGGSSGLGDGVR